MPPAPGQLGNKIDGVLIQSGSTQNTIGGTAAGTRNLRSRPTHGTACTSSIAIRRATLLWVTISVRTPREPLAARCNGASGVAVFDGAPAITRSVEPHPDPGNVISANTTYGVYLSDAGTTGNVVEGNLIGTDYTGLKALGDGKSGVIIQSGATKNTIGGKATGWQCGSPRTQTGES